MQCLAFGFEGKLSKFLTAFTQKWFFWAFHLILVTLFLADFGDKVTKILSNSLFSFGFALQMENIVQKITQPKWRKTKNEVTKICDEPGIWKFFIFELSRPVVLRFSHFTPTQCFLIYRKWLPGYEIIWTTNKGLTVV